MMTSYVGYARVSTAKQGKSGLGLEAQEAAIAAHLRQGDELLSPLFVETESGKSDDRPKLAKALALSKRTGATLIVAKLDRLSRNLSFIAQLMESGVRFVACDMPEANELTLHIMAAVAQAERKAISRRTKEALAAAKARGTKLGGWRGHAIDGAALSAAGVAARKAGAEAFNVDARGALAELQSEGVTGLSALARELNARGIRTSRGGQWQASQVARVIGAAAEVA